MKSRVIHAFNAEVGAIPALCGLEMRSPITSENPAEVTCRRCHEVLGRMKAREERRPLQPHGIKGAIGS